jgi:hypothetical protein
MKKHLSLFLQLALLCGGALVVEAQTDHVTLFTGTWKLNLAKSKFKLGPAFKSFTITFTADGTRHLDLIGPDGETHKPSLPWSDGKEVAVENMENTTATSKIQGRTFHDSWKQNGKVIEDVHGSVSRRGRTLRTRVDGTDNQGHPFHNELTFDKQ